MLLHFSELPAGEMIRAAGETLHVRRLGSGPRLVLLHGGPGLDHHLLLPLATPLATRHEIWLVDLPSHGRAGGPPIGLKKTLERLGRFLAAVEAPAIGGHSLGAFCVRELLRTKIIRPRAAVLLCPPGVPGGKSQRQNLPAARAGAQAAIERRSPRSAAPPPAPDPAGEDGRALREELRRELAATGAVAPELLEALEAAVLRSPAHHMRLVSELLPLLRAAIPACDPRCPVLVIAGACDPVAPPSVAAAVAGATRGSELHLVPGAGHFPWAGGALPLAEKIRRFLAEHLD